MTADKKTDKKTYEKPTVKSVKIDKAVMVAASRSGMGNCKITLVVQLAPSQHINGWLGATSIFVE